MSRKDIGKIAVVALLLGCSSDEGGQATSTKVLPDADSILQVVPEKATLEDVNTLAHDPSGPDVTRLLGDTVAAQVRRGLLIVRQTPRYASAYVGNSFSCANCHLNAGQKAGAIPLVGIAGLFPQYRSRSGRLISLEDRIRGCFSRSMNGTPPPYDSPELLAISAYIAWLSRQQPFGVEPQWRGRNRIVASNLLPIEKLDVERGSQLYLRHCAMCHGTDGEGVDLKTTKPGPLWGPKSWNDGAGAARVYTLAGYIRYAMPLTQPGVLTDEEAQHIAAFINAQDRPVFLGKQSDYPNGEVPVDAVYYPQRYRDNPLRQRLRSIATQ